jgi:hypothetical protein
MRDDHKLLESAAKAAGIEGPVLLSEPSGHPYIATPGGVWNPLTDDGDALRMAVKLQLGISVPPVVDGRVEVVTFYWPIISIIEYPKAGGRCAATRRAIVRAAAEIGKARHA